MQKLLSINIGKKEFGRRYEEACSKLGVPNTTIRSRNCCFILADNTVTLTHKNIRLNPSEYGYVFIRVAGKFSLMTSLVGQFFQSYKIPLSDNVYLQHTRNEEKITQMLNFTTAGIPIPKTILFTIAGFSENQETILAETTFPCVLKTNGSQGKNVWKIESAEQLTATLPELQIKEEVAMVQEYIPNTYDIRALYMHGDIIGAIKRSSVDGFLNNVSAGGTSEPLELTEAEITLAKKAAEVLGRSFAGVDIVRTESGPCIFEVNLGPQIYGFEGATGMNVPAELITRIHQEFFNQG